jgi:heat shock protein HslJ
MTPAAALFVRPRRWATLGLVATTLTLGACVATTPVAPVAMASVDGLPGTLWGLPVQGGVSLPLGQSPELQFISPTQVVGTGGCNRFAGPVRMAGTSLSFGALAGTRRACAPELMRTEERFLHTLSITREGRFEPGFLVLMDQQGQELLRLQRLR